MSNLFMIRYLSFVAVALATVQLLTIHSTGADDVSNNRYNINSSTNTETIKIGNTKNKNYNIQETNFLPTQLTQVVLNVPKLNKKLRKTRRPTVEEFAIKRKIVQVYDEAKLGSRLDMIHLGYIIQALNPKYIATDRVRKVAFADPRDPINVEAPYQELEGPLELRLESGPIGVQLDELNERFRDQVRWSQGFIEELANTSDEILSAHQVAFKRVILCLSHPHLCNLFSNRGSYSEFEREPDQMESSDSRTNEVYELPPEERQHFNPQQQQPQQQHFADAPRQIEPNFGGYQQQQQQQLYNNEQPRIYEQPDYEPRQVPPAQNFRNSPPPPRGPPSQPILPPPPQFYNNQGGPVHQRNRFLPSLRNLRFSDQQSKPRILNQPPRQYPGY